MTDFSIETLTQNFDIVNPRLELYPNESPTCYVVGFSITHKVNKKNIYYDTQIPLDDANGKTSDEIAHLGWDKLKNTITDWCKSVINITHNPNSSFIPIAI
jgi:hypothetical protein